MCPPCQKPLDPLRARTFAVIDGTVVSYCSPACKERAAEPLPLPALFSPRRSRRTWRILLVASPVVAAASVLLGARISFDNRTATAALSVRAPASVAFASVPELQPEFGPALPPPEFFIESERWVHPLAGPVRRLPGRPSRRFGVGRGHDSPESCGAGHCGVDVGEVRGEAVLAVHDGTVERVVESVGDDRGGKYVRLLHAGGRIITQYMHLDEIAADLKPGIHVRAGDKLGTVGDSGTKNSGPHLHFTFATRGGENQPEVYADPLALLTVWTLVQP